MQLIERPRRNRKNAWIRAMASENFVGRSTLSIRCLYTRVMDYNRFSRCQVAVVLV